MYDKSSSTRRSLNLDDWAELERFIGRQTEEFGSPLNFARKSQLLNYFRNLIEEDRDGFLLGSFIGTELKCLISFYFYESVQTGFIAHIFSQSQEPKDLGLTMAELLDRLESYGTRSYFSVMMPKNVERFQKYWDRHTPSIRNWSLTQTKTILAGQKPDEPLAWEAMGRQVWEHDLVLVAREHISS
jgi:hypothetical protein